MGAAASATVGLMATPLVASAELAPAVDRAASGTPFDVRTRDGLRLAATSHGDRSLPAIVFVHGLGQSRLSWNLQLPLAERFRLVTFDLRGHGDSDRPQDPSRYSRDDLWGDDLAAVLAASGVRRPLLVAWSMGGIVVGHYLRRHGSAAVSGVNLVDAVTSFEAPFRTTASGTVGADLASPDLGVRSAAIAAFLGLTFARRPPMDAFAPLLAVNGMVPRELHVGLAGLSTNGIDAAYATAPPMLLTHGGGDALVRTAMAERMLRISPSSRLSLYRGIGHSPFLEDPTRFNSELAAYAVVAAKGRLE